MFGTEQIEHNTEVTLSLVVVASCSGVGGTGKLVASKGNMDGAKYKEIVEKNLFWSTSYLYLGRKFTSQQNTEPKHRTRYQRKGWEKEGLCSEKLRYKFEWGGTVV